MKKLITLLILLGIICLFPIKPQAKSIYHLINNKIYFIELNSSKFINIHELFNYKMNRIQSIINKLSKLGKVSIISQCNINTINNLQSTISFKDNSSNISIRYNPSIVNNKVIENLTLLYKTKDKHSSSSYTYLRLPAVSRNIKLSSTGYLNLNKYNLTSIVSNNFNYYMLFVKPSMLK